MTDLATMRAGCQRGEMPTYAVWLNAADRIAIDLSWWRLHHTHAWLANDYLDALAALQQALWPGSRTAIRWYWFGDTLACEVDIMDWLSNGMGWGVVSSSERCPSEECARLDAILAGLQGEKDDG